MIDLHNHLLPGIDDGAPDLDTALRLARMAVEEGITHLVCTPHIHPGRYDNDIAGIEAARRRLVAGLQEAGILLQVAAAAEVRYGSELMQGIEQGRLPFLGHWHGRRVLLLELPHSEVPFGAERLTEWLLQHGVMPMIAHPERNKGVMHCPRKLKPFIEQGCLLQVTAGAVAGRFGEPARLIAQALLELGLVTVLASDAHNVQHRPPALVEGMRQAARIVGDFQAERLVLDTPWQIACGHFA